MHGYIENLEAVYDYYKKRSDAIFNEWLETTEKEIPEQILENIWARYRNFEGKCEGLFTAIKIAEQFQNETKKA